MRESLIALGITLACCGMLIEFVALARRTLFHSQLRPMFQWYHTGFLAFYSGCVLIVIGRLL